MKKIFLVLILSLVSFELFASVGVGGVFSINNPDIERTDLSYHWDPGYGPGVGFILAFENIVPNIILSPEINYWQAKDSTTVNTINYEIKVSDIQLNLTVHYLFSGPVNSFFAGGGLGYNFIKYKGAIKNALGQQLWEMDSSEQEIGLYFDAGYQFPISDFTAFALARYAFIHNVDTFSLQFGLIMKIK